MVSGKATAVGTKLQVAWCKDGPGAKSERPKNRAAHLEWVVKTGQVELAGPILNDNGDIEGSLMVMDANDAESVLKDDPYANAGVFEGKEVRGWVKGAVNNKEGGMLGEGRWFVVWCVDKEGLVDRRKENRPDHLKWWKDSGRKGWIGPFVENGSSVGSMVFLQGESIEEVKEWAQGDPYNKADLFERVTVKEVKKVVENFELVGK